MQNLVNVFFDLSDERVDYIFARIEFVKASDMLE